MFNLDFSKKREKRALIEAGKIASQIRNELEKIVKPGKSVIEICEYSRKKIQELGGKQAYPVHVNINPVVSNYTSPEGDQTIINKDAIVSVNIGVHIDGFIAGTAKTILNKTNLKNMMLAAEAGVNAAINTIQNGISTRELVPIIEKAIMERGYKPIQNLLSCRTDRFKLVTIPMIPSTPHAYVKDYIIKKNEVYDISVFSVPLEASALVIDGPPSNIYLYRKKQKVKNKTSQRMLKFIQSEYKTLPFASRWVYAEFSNPERHEAFLELLKSNCIHSFPMLIEKSRAPVAHIKHTVLVTENGCIVTTM